MITETRIIVRLIALWVIFILSLGLTFWASQNVVISLVKKANGGYQMYLASKDMPMGGGYYNPCIQPPMYPQQSMSGMSQTQEDKLSMDKYNQEYQKYTEKIEMLCMAEMDKQQQAKQGQEKSSSLGDMLQYALLTLLGVVTAILSLMQIRKTENA